MRQGQVAFAQNVFDLNVVIRENFEVSSPADPHYILSCHLVALRVDERMIVAHQGRDFFNIVRIDSGSEICDGFHAQATGNELSQHVDPEVRVF